MNGNVPVNVQNIVQSGTYVLLQYSGTRSGSGSFVAGSLPAGATITDDTANGQVILTYVSLLEPRVVIPTLNTNEVVVAVATPQQYGAVGDGITDDSAAFQAAMNAVYNSGGQGGGVVYVPAVCLLHQPRGSHRCDAARRLDGLDEELYAAWSERRSKSISAPARPTPHPLSR